MSAAGYRNLAAELRAIEEGHRCRYDPATGQFVVTSDSRPGVEYVVSALAAGEWIVFGCDCPRYRKGRPPEMGLTPCKHTALLARRLEREGLAELDYPTGWWKLTAKALAGPEQVGRDTGLID